MFRKEKSDTLRFLILTFCVLIPIIHADDGELIKQLNERINSDYEGFLKNKKCCSASNIVDTKIGKNAYGKQQEEITCSAVGDVKSEVRNLGKCSDGSFQEIILDSSLYSITPSSNQMAIQNQCDKDEPPIIFRDEDKNFCVGLKKRITDDGSYDDEEDDYDYDDDDEALQVRPDELACPLSQNQTKRAALNQSHILVLKYCPNACGMKSDPTNPMCIRTCSCPKNFVLGKNGRCKQMDQSIIAVINSNAEKSLDGTSRREWVFESGLQLDANENFGLVNSMRRQCPDGYRKRYLNPSERCSDLFTIGTAHFNRMWCKNNSTKNPTNLQVKLMIHNEHINANMDAFSGECTFENAEGLHPDEFCLNIEEDGHYTAEVCEKIPYKYSWYPVILSISTLFLLATLVIFSLKHVVLINNYTSIVWHFVLCMFIAFIILIFNQSTEIKPVSEPLCVAVGILQNFFFLASFIFMTILSIETCWRSRQTFVSLPTVFQNLVDTAGGPILAGATALNANEEQTPKNHKSNSTDSLLSKTFFYAGNGENKFDRKRNIQEVACSYVIAGVLTIGALIANFLPTDALTRCDHFRPRFGENKCFYSDRINKAIWFYIPIGICLLINLIMFFINGFLLFKHRTNFQSFLWTSARYLLLVVGIGVIWTFEIFSGIFADDETEWKWYVTDVLQMLQGAWIFLAFVVFNPSAREAFNIGSKQEADNTAQIPMLGDGGQNDPMEDQ